MSQVSDEFDRGMAVDAMLAAKQAAASIVAHEAVCAERYSKISDDIAGLRGLFKWAGGALFTLLLAAFGFLIQQVGTSNTALAERRDAASIAASRIDLLQQTLANERRNQKETPVER